jgi:hypothetical protein
LIYFIRSFQLHDTEEYVIAYKRYARDITPLVLPKEIAIYEYGVLRGYSLSKCMASVDTNEIIYLDGVEAK